MTLKSVSVHCTESIVQGRSISGEWRQQAHVAPVQGDIGATGRLRPLHYTCEIFLFFCSNFILEILLLSVIFISFVDIFFTLINFPHIQNRSWFSLYGCVYLFSATLLSIVDQYLSLCKLNLRSFIISQFSSLNLFWLFCNYFYAICFLLTSIHLSSHTVGL